MNAAELAARADAPPRTTDAVLADFASAVQALLISADRWQSYPPDRTELAEADATLTGLHRLLIELRTRGTS